MSLVSHLNSSTSPLYIYFKENYKGLRGFLSEDLKTLSTLDTLIPSDKKGYPWGCVGHMVEYLFQLNWGLNPTELYPMKILKNANSTPAVLLYNSAINVLKKKIDPSINTFIAQCNILYSLAFLESVFRSEGVVKIQNLTITPVILEDLTNLWNYSIVSNSHYSFKDKIIYNPHFSLSHLVGGADGNFIKVNPKEVGNTLIDMKTTIEPNIESVWIYHLLGSFFLDKLSYYKIKNVEVFLPRQNARVCWKIESLILGSTNYPTVRKAKAEFMDAVKQIPASKAMGGLVGSLIGVTGSG